MLSLQNKAWIKRMMEDDGAVAVDFELFHYLFRHLSHRPDLGEIFLSLPSMRRQSAASRLSVNGILIFDFCFFS
jgi:hypothetical protein